jgi:hypothetical protein
VTLDEDDMLVHQFEREEGFRFGHGVFWHGGGVGFDVDILPSSPLVKTRYYMLLIKMAILIKRGIR